MGMAMVVVRIMPVRVAMGMAIIMGRVRMGEKRHCLFEQTYPRGSGSLRYVAQTWGAHKRANPIAQ